MVFNPLIVNRDDVAQGTRCSLNHGGSLLAVLVAFSHHQFSQIRGRQPYQLCEKFCTSSTACRSRKVGPPKMVLGVGLAKRSAPFIRMKAGRVVRPWSFKSR